MIKNILFDLGGVVVTLDHGEAVRRFAQLGLKQAADELDPYTQGGVFGDLEAGRIDAEEFGFWATNVAGDCLMRIA